MSALRHRHEFWLFAIHFGPHGPQDIHYHPCVAEPDAEETCDRVLMAAGRACSGLRGGHLRHTLTEDGPSVPGPIARLLRRRGASALPLDPWTAGQTAQELLDARAAVHLLQGTARQGGKSSAADAYARVLLAWEDVQRRLDLPAVLVALAAVLRHVEAGAHRGHRASCARLLAPPYSGPAEPRPCDCGLQEALDRVKEALGGRP